MIALGEWMFGLTPFGWRFGVALFGTLSVLLLTFVARRLFRSTLLGAVAGLLLALDGLAIVMSRTALLDGLLAFWLSRRSRCVLDDRDVGRLRLLERYEAAQRGRDAHARRAARRASGGGGSLAGVCFGLACATKWSGVFVLAACGLLVLAWDISARKALGLRRPYSAGIVYDGIPAFLSMVVTAVVTYLVSWTGWFLADNSHDRQWAADQGGPVVSIFGALKWQLPDWLAWLAPDALRSLIHYHSAMFGFHNGLNVEDSPHPYAANPCAGSISAGPRSSSSATTPRPRTSPSRPASAPRRRRPAAPPGARATSWRRHAGDLVGRLLGAGRPRGVLARPARLAGGDDPRAGRLDLAAVAAVRRTGRSSSSTRSRSCRSSCSR